MKSVGNNPFSNVSFESEQNQQSLPIKIPIIPDSTKLFNYDPEECSDTFCTKSTKNIDIKITN